MTPYLPRIGQVLALLLGYLQGITVSVFGEHAAMLSSILGGSSSYQQSKPPASEPASAPEENQNDAQQAETKAASEPQAKQGTTAAQETTAARETTKAQSLQATAQAKPAEAAPKASDAENEAFARAAAQRNVDSVRTRALLDTISPVNNSAVESAKSYVSKVEPEAQNTKAGNAASVAKPALDKAA